MSRTNRIVFGAIYGSKLYFGVVFVMFSSSSELWLGLLTVTTPGSVEHHQDMFLLLTKEFLVVGVEEAPWGPS